MSIEDVKQWTNERLNISLSKKMGWTDNGAPAVYYGLIPKYTDNIADAREAQTQAITANTKLFVDSLYDVINYDDGTYPQLPLNALDVTYDHDGVAYLLKATPRQIAEAAYLTLKG